VHTAFRVIAIIMAASGIAFGLFTAVFGIISEDQAIHAFHNTVVATLLLVLTAPPLIVAARDPERSAASLQHLAALGVAGLATMAIALTIDPFTLPVIVLIGVLWALRPRGQPPVTSGRPSPVLLVLAVAGAVPLAAYALGQAELQRIDDMSEHADFYHWVETSFTAASILLLGFLWALRPGASRMAAWSAGLSLAILGVASLLLGDYASAMDTPWAWAAVAGSAVFVAVAEWVAGRDVRRPPVRSER
jgi:hypothetical protein